MTKFPAVAAGAYDWDPTTVLASTNRKCRWKCNLGHAWDATLNSRTSKLSGRPICSGYKLLVGFNDLQTKFPAIAAEAYGWDPKSVTAGTDKRCSWKCGFGHIWDTTVSQRTTNRSGCPICAESGFNPGKDAWFYLMQRPGEQQLGITNNMRQRIKQHEKYGWILLDHSKTASGKKVQQTESLFKKWLKKEIGLMKGTTENWSTISMEVQSLAELKTKSGIETDLF